MTTTESNYRRMDVCFKVGRDPLPGQLQQKNSQATETMASVLRFRSIWGIDPGTNYEHWDKWFPTLKAQGYGIGFFFHLRVSQANLIYFFFFFSDT